MNLLQSNPSSQVISDIRRSIKRWNVLYPLDKWYRDKYNIQYNSIQHRQLDVINIRVEFEEHVLYVESMRELSRESNKAKYKPGYGDWLVKQTMQEDLSQEEVEYIYDKIDISKLEGDPDEIKI